MPRVKLVKKRQIIDMTAMVDVAFLLLTFLILTAQPKETEILPVDVPLSVVSASMPDDALIITVGDNGKATLGIKDSSIRQKTLEKIGIKYGVLFNEKEKHSFEKIDVFGSPLNQINHLLSLTPAQMEKMKPTGIPTDSIGKMPSELFNWIIEARLTAKEIHFKELHVAIKADGNENYTHVKKIIDILQSQKINRFSLVTNLKTEL